MKKFFLTFTLLLLTILPVFALEELNFKFLYISDNAKIIDSESFTKITSIIQELKDKTSAEIAVVTLRSLQGKSIEDTAVEIGRKYKVGAKDANNGVVIVVAPNEREVRLEVGMGLESEITNSLAETIVNVDMVPYFAKNEYSKGIHRGVASTAKLIAQSYNVTLDSVSNAPPKTAKQNESKSEKIPFWVMPILFIMLLLKKGRGGNFGGGGGFSGGKGATGRW